ncbi:MAG: Verru_Chthon cassette protein A, partial [Verrucomicrobiaceae bacterium]
NYFTARGGTTSSNSYASTRAQVHGLRLSRGNFYPRGSLDTAYNVDDGRLAAGVSTHRSDRRPKVPHDINGVKMINNNPGDWDRGLSKNVDGAFINKADEGNANFDYNRTGGTKLPYFLGYSGFEEAGPTFFSPNRLMPSAVMFGSLPTRVLEGDPWETLLFRPPVTIAGKPDHRGFDKVPDHYFLDLFHMPVVEPYAISEPFSTAGKINLNYEIAPFGYVKNGSASYIERKTGIHAVLKATKMLIVPNSARDGGHTEDPLGNSDRYRFHIDRKQTLKVIQDRLDKQGLFKTASEICEIPLVPEGRGITNPLNYPWASFWNNQNGLTGDNQRERPYAHIFPRLTTRSNVYTVYVRAQGIRKNPNAPADEFDPITDQVTGEYRGQTTIERYIDPNDPALRDYDPAKDGSGSGGGAVDRFYRFRIVNTKQFIGN